MFEHLSGWPGGAVQQPRGDLPLEFDSVFYRDTYGDLTNLDDLQIADHYAKYGAGEGRVAARCSRREDFLAAVVDRVDGEVLEIGPFASPLVTGPRARYLDVLDADGLRARAARIGIDPSRIPARIDYVGELSQIDARFAAVVSCHVIEHQPDLVRHLQDVARLLAPGGRYLLIVPDKRFCFDSLIAESTIADILQAHHERRTRHTLKSVIEHRALTVHSDGSRHWRGDHGTVDLADVARRVEAATQEYRATDGYIDVHAWYWSPESFRSTMWLLHRLGLSPFVPVRVWPPSLDRFEFCAVLERA